MAWSLVQSLKSTSTSVASTAVTAAFASSVTAGNRIFMFTVAFQGSATTPDIATPTKSAGTATISAFTQLKSATVVPGTSKLFVDIWTATVTGSGTLTLSATSPSTAGSELGWTAQEYSGLDSSAGTGCLDVSATGTGNSSNTATIATGTTAATTGAGQLALAMVGDWGVGATWTLSVANGFTKVTAASLDANGNSGLAVANKTSASGATESATWTNGAVSDSDNALVVVIKLAASGSAFSGSVALTGSGTLTLAGTPRETGSAGFSGSGSLGFTGTPAIPGTVATSGSGSLSFTATPNEVGTIALAGSGALSLGGTPAIPGTAPLSGSGTLTLVGAVVFVGSVGLSGGGTLTLTATPSIPGAAGLSGAGTLSGAATPGETGSVAFSGSGLLTLSGVVGGGGSNFSGLAMLAGSGSLGTSATPAFAGSVALSSEGVLTLSTGGTVYQFITPGHEMPVDPTGKDFLWSRVKYIQGDAVIKYRDGTYKLVQVHNPDEPNIDTVYLGGHVHTVSDAEAILLIQAGYGSYLTVVPG